MSMWRDRFHPQPRALERIPQTQLNLARWFVSIRIRRENLPEIRTAQNMTGNIEIRMVEQVEQIPANLQPVILAPEGHALRQAEIDIRESGSSENIPALVSELKGVRIRARCREVEGARVEPAPRHPHLIGSKPALRDRCLTCGVRVCRHWARRVRVADQVRPRRISECRSKIGRAHV